MTDKKIVAFDIETIANRAVELPEPDIKFGNLKDPAKIKEKVDAAKAAQVAKMGLDPYTSLILCFGWHDYKHEDGVLVLSEDLNEKPLLQSIWEKLSEYTHFVTFNGMSFDVPTIKIHSMLNRVRSTVDISNRKYTISNHYDLRMILGNWDQYAKGTLDDYLRRILGRSKMEGISGDMVQDYFDCGDIQAVASYCIDDARKTYELFEVVYEYYL